MILFLLLIAGCSNSTDQAKESNEKVAESEQKQLEELVEEEVFQQPIMDYIKEGEAIADIMVLGMEPEKEEEMMNITAKMNESLAENSEWFMSYLSEVGEGEVLPYHSNFGITEDEYHIFLDSENHMKLMKIGEAPITVTREGDLLTLEANNTDTLNSVTFDLKANTVKTDYGTLEYNGEIEASDRQVITGPWSGFSWRLVEGDISQLEDIDNIDETTEITIIDFYIGQLKETEETLVYIEYKGIKNLEKIQEEEHLLFKQN